MIMGIFVFYLIFLATDANAYQNYKISMVAPSNRNDGQPALFTHAESPVWDADNQWLYFVDVKQNNVHRLDYATGELHTKNIAYGEVNVVSPVANSKRLLVAVRSSLYLLDWEEDGGSALRLLTTVDNGRPDNVINEGKSDIEGRFVFGTKGPQVGDDVQPDKSSLYSVSQHSLEHPKILLRPVSISNGLVWALNNTVIYYTDSATQKVEAFDYDARGEISGRRTIIDVSEYGYESAIPDGITIDSNGNLWIALMFGGSVLHVNPDTRRIIFTYKLPVNRVTSCAWGGPNLDELFVTTSATGTDPEPLAGAIFTIRNTGSSGTLHNSFQMENADNY